MAKKVHIVFYLLILSLLLINSQSFSQYGEMRFEHLSSEDGIKQTATLCMHQDKEGFIWFGTERGIYRYDGYNFKLYQHNPDDITSIGNNTVQCIVEDSSGDLWMGTLGSGDETVWNASRASGGRFRRGPRGGTRRECLRRAPGDAHAPPLRRKAAGVQAPGPRVAFLFTILISPKRTTR